MKKYLILLVAAISTSVFVSCSDDDFTPPAYVTFEGEELDLTVTQNSSASIDVTVYTNNISGGDRSFDISVDDASTLGAEAYVLPETVTIPGGSNVGTFTVEVSDNNVDDAGETLVLQIDDNSGTFTGAPVTLNISKFCPIEAEDFIGDYSGNGSWSGLFGYQTEVVITESESGELLIDGLLFQWLEGAEFWGEVIAESTPVTIEINEETGEITIPEQFYVETTYNGAPQTPYYIKGTGSVNACTKEMTIYPVLIQGTTQLTGLNWNGGIRFVETIKLDTAAPL